MRARLVVPGRVLVLLAGAFWLGGLTFYAAVVIPTAHDVLGSHRRVGFITQRVTQGINLAGAAALAVLLIHLIACWPGRRWQRWGLLATWLLMAGVQLALFRLHPALDRLLDDKSRQILDEYRFYGLHRIYLILTIIQQIGGIVHVFALVSLWRLRDGGLSARVVPAATE